MQPARIRARIWVEACLGACRAAGVFATVLARGDADAGSVLLKWRRPDGAGGVLAPHADMDGERTWILATGSEPVSEADADAYWQRQRGRDPDLWVVEVEGETLWHPLGEPIETTASPAEDDPQAAALRLFKR